MSEKPPYQMTRQEYIDSYKKVIYGLFTKFPDKSFIMGMQFPKSHWSKGSAPQVKTFQVTGQNDLCVGYISIVQKNGKTQKAQYVLNEWDAHRLFIKRAIELGLDVPQNVLDEYNFKEVTA